MSNPITDIQARYLSTLMKNVGQAKCAELKKQLKIPVDAPISELTKDDAYRLITKLVTESTPDEVEAALAYALGRNRGQKQPNVDQLVKTE